MELTQPTTQDEARQQAIDWQNWQAEQSLTTMDMLLAVNHFEKTAKQFNLTEEFAENGII